ncbi:MAG: histidine kinase [Candidatus Saganbacteria bacterium]|uniref:histidine kinase n=1 Tax=Candidatus Saganbacteria bacterium TaxID=2575572 RepID=A0A833KZU4_UNCSA|nr:MAG: histidine kinase [Candidatus Saganbacteria bacterium]
MFSTFTLIGIFTEIFASGILFSGFYSFIKRFLLQKQWKDLTLSLIFAAFSVFTVSTVLSQIFYNLDWGISEQIFLQKVIAVSLYICSYLLLIFIKQKLNLKKTVIFILAFIPFLFFIYQILLTPASQITLNFRADVFEPIVSFGMLPEASKLIFALMWVVYGSVVGIKSLFENRAKRVLALISFISSILFLGAYGLTFLYVNTGESAILLVSWIFMLVGIFGITIVENIPPNSVYALKPFNFFRSRVLFKLIFFFVMLIIFLFEATTLATINLSKQALYNSLINNYKEIAQNISEKASANFSAIQKLVAQKSVGRRIVYIIDQNGIIIAHPDYTQISQKITLKLKNIIQNKIGGGKFPSDEFGEINVGAFAPIKNIGGAVIVEEPLREAYLEMRKLETNSLLFIMAGIFLTVLVGIFFAQSIENSIRQLISGTEAVSKGDLSHRIFIDSIDEIGRLAAAFNKMTKDLKDSQERLILSEKLASLGTMAAGMAHEIKNPLVSLRTFSQLLQQKWEDPEFRNKFAQIVPNEIERINKIAESLLKFGRPMKPELTNVSVNNILEEIMTLFESECKKNNIRLTKKFADLPEITGDAQQLSQSFVNILLNAIQSMEEKKGGDLIIKTDVGEVLKLGKPSHAGVEKEKGELVWEAEEAHSTPIPAVFVEITDTGQGIDPEKIKSLFDPFFTTKTKGTGMGLPITLRIIEDHKGSIKVKSKIGNGTTFLITLPQKMEQI